ncbi:MAG: twin-arginine translocation signal domain-containing protein, partial [OM182 bacterium]|nr:twin-arginine translocation signal domain-containing protein [OM182 bacterium]MDP4871612.1 twin-arginine translocation signal domain-containing protein [Gammaproteobacteria bacterium]
MAKTKSMGRLGSTGISRRTFLTRSALFAGGIAAGSLFPFTASAQSRRVENVGLQLYTLRKELAEDFDGTLARVAEL